MRYIFLVLTRCFSNQKTDQHMCWRASISLSFRFNTQLEWIDQIQKNRLNLIFHRILSKMYPSFVILFYGRKDLTASRNAWSLSVRPSKSENSFEFWQHIYSLATSTFCWFFSLSVSLYMSLSTWATTWAAQAGSSDSAWLMWIFWRKPLCRILFPWIFINPTVEALSISVLSGSIFTGSVFWEPQL